MRHDLEESGLRRVEHLRHALHRLRKQLALSHHAEPSWPLGDQHIAIREKGDRPGLNETVRDRDDAVVVQG
jgi:hypothetical protein